MVALSLITPLEGDCLLNSAIIPVEFTSSNDFFNEIGVLLNKGLSTIFFKGTSAFILLTSFFLKAIILSNIVILTICN